MRRSGFVFAAVLSLGTVLGLGGVPELAFAKDMIEGQSVAGLTRTSIPGFREAYIKPGVNFADYTQAMIAPLTWAETADRRADDSVAKITPKNREYLANRFSEMVSARLDENRRIVPTAAEAGTLVIEARMLTAKPNRTPYDMREPGLMTAYIYGVGAASIRIDVRDGRTGEVLLSLADRREGENFRDNFNLAFFWGDTEQFMRRWAGALSEALPARIGPKAAG